MRKRTWLVVASVAVVGGLAVDQAVQWTALSDDAWGTRPVMPFDPPLFNASQAESLERIEALARGEDPRRNNVRFDPELGWAPDPSLRTPDYAYDEHGARVDGTPLRAERSPDVRRIVVIGCSFTHGDEVTGADTWAARLEQHRPDVEVANLGVGAYGLGQAWMRLQRDGLALEPDEVWLGWLPAVSLRVTSLYPPALRHHDQVVSFKPRFVLDGDDGNLRLVPSPARTPGDIQRLLTDQSAFLSAVGEHDMWVARHPDAYAPRGSRWTHHFAATRLLLTRAEGKQREPAPWLLDLGGPVGGLIRALVRSVARDATEAGARFRLLVLPDRRDLRSTTDRSTPYWTFMVDELRRQGLEVIDLAPALVGAGAIQDRALWMRGGHYSPEGNEAVAAALAREL